MPAEKLPVAVVTGAASGMGRAHAEGLAAAGFAIIALDRDGEGLQKLEHWMIAKGASIVIREMDVVNESAVSETFNSLIDVSGSVDVLVNNAGAALAQKALVETELADWEADIRLNLTGQFLCIRAVLPAMMQANAGCIINIVTSSAFSGITAALYRSEGQANLVPYVAAKAGVIGMTRALAREVGKHGIRVNAIAPGFTPTERVKQVFPEQAIARMVDDQAIKSVQQPGDVTGAVIFLASQAGLAITGQVLRVDYGGSMG
jgi:3-oxoacyl-[acyl-carrier protein] reductase